MAIDLFDIIIKDIDVALASYKEATATGRPSSYDEYRYMCGKINGVQMLRDRVLELRQSLEESE